MKSLALRTFFCFLLFLICLFRTDLVSAQNEQEELQALEATQEPEVAAATSAINLTLSPVNIQLDVKPGATQTAEMKIRNNGSETERLKVTFGTFGYNQQTQTIDLNEEIIGPEKEWISVNEPEFTVEPSEWKTLTLTFSPPPDSALTFYYAAIFSRVNQAVTDDAAQIAGAPAILVLTNIDSPLGKRELQIDQFYAQKFWVEFLPQTFTLKLKNTGNIHLAPSGNIFIDGQGKKDLAVLTLNPERSLTLPNSIRSYQIPWNDGFPKFLQKKEKEKELLNEKGEPVYELAWNFAEADKFRIGKYTAHLLLVYDNGQRDIPIESSISFWVIPWRICLAVFVILIFVLIGLRSIILSVIKPFRKKSKKSAL